MRRRVAVIVNMQAQQAPRGSFRRELDRAVERFGVEVVETPTLDVARAEIRRVVSRGVDVVVLVGGDGTLVMGLTLLAEAARGASREPAIAVIAAGSGNAFARAMRDIDPKHAANLRDRLRQLATEPLRPFFVRTLSVMGVRTPFCGFGIDAQLLEDHHDVSGTIDRIPGVRRVMGPRLRYAASIALRSAPLWALGERPVVTLRNLGSSAPEVRGRDRTVIRDVAAGDVLWSGPCTLAACATIPYFGFGLRMFAFASGVGERFQVRASDASIAEILRNTRAAFRGDYFSPHTHDFLVDRVRIELSAPLPLEAGGELLGTHSHADVSLAPPIQVV